MENSVKLGTLSLNGSSTHLTSTSAIATAMEVAKRNGGTLFSIERILAPAEFKRRDADSDASEGERRYSAGSIKEGHSVGPFSVTDQSRPVLRVQRARHFVPLNSVLQVGRVLRVTTNQDGLLPLNSVLQVGRVLRVTTNQDRLLPLISVLQVGLVLRVATNQDGLLVRRTRISQVDPTLILDSVSAASPPPPPPPPPPPLAPLPAAASTNPLLASMSADEYSWLPLGYAGCFGHWFNVKPIVAVSPGECVTSR